MSHTVLAQAREVVSQVEELSKDQGFPLVSGTSVYAKSMTELIQATKEKKPLHQHGWMNDQGEYCVCTLWAFEDDGPKFVTIFAKAD